MNSTKVLSLSWGLTMALGVCAAATAAPAKKGAKTTAEAKKEESVKSEKASTAAATSSGQVAGARYSYGMAGCGPGSMIFKKNDRGSQIGASLVNEPGVLSTIRYVGGIFGLVGSSQTFAISSGTSNCEAPTGGHVARNYIENNSEALQKDLARGAGESIEGLSKVLGCSDQEQLTQKLRDNFVEAFSGDKVENANKIIQLAPATCAVHG